MTPIAYKKARLFLKPKDDLLRLLMAAWCFVMWTCIGVLVEKPKGLATSIHFFLFVAVGVAGLCDLIFIAARSFGARRNWRHIAIGTCLLMVLTFIESVLIAHS